MSRLYIRPPSASAEAARQRDAQRVARLSVLERLVKALALGRRGRQLQDMTLRDAVAKPAVPRPRGRA